MYILQTPFETTNLKKTVKKISKEGIIKKPDKHSIFCDSMNIIEKNLVQWELCKHLKTFT